MESDGVREDNQFGFIDFGAICSFLFSWQRWTVTIFLFISNEFVGVDCTDFIMIYEIFEINPRHRRYVGLGK